jgi:hypothetical protein
MSSSPSYASRFGRATATTVKASAFQAGWTPSPVAASTYQIIIPNTVITLLAPTSGTHVNAGTTLTATASVTSNVTVHIRQLFCGYDADWQRQYCAVPNDVDTDATRDVHDRRASG